MIKEDYVSFEIAKLLKEKGFNEICRKFYKCWPTNPKLYCCDKSQMFDYCTNSSLSRFNYVGDEMNIAAPTLQMVMKWLREVHNIAIDTEWEHLWYAHVKPMTANPTEDDYYQCFSAKYEQAVEVAIKYCLEKKLIF